MKAWKKNIILGLVIILLVGCSFFIGSWYGFWSGINRIFEEKATSEGNFKVVILRDIRKGKSDEATKLLEMSLDGDILVYNSYSEMSSSIFDRIFDHYAPVARNQYGPNFMKSIAKYRKEYPSNAEPDIKRHIEEILAKFSEK